MLSVLRRAVPLLAVLAVVLLPAGCGTRTGKVKGKISVGGQPLKNGVITFLSQVGKKDPYAATITDGLYETSEIPVGDAKIIIYHSSDVPPDKSQGGDRVPPKKGRNRSPDLVPVEYHNPDTSGLSMTIAPGPNTFDRDL